MKKIRLLISSLFIAALFSCSDENDNPPVQDLTAPELGFAEGRDSFRPMENEVMPATKDHLHLRFSVSDESGIGQVLVDIHNSFDGHTHGRLNNTFTALNVKDIYSSDASQPFLRFPEGATFLNVDGSATDIYWAGPTSRVENNVLAGPYDIVISAVDVNGNQTSFADNSNYITTFYIERPYAPMIAVTNLHDGEIEGQAGEALEVQGSVAKADHELGSEITFLWVRLMEEDDDHGHEYRVSGEEFYEKMWGTSAYKDGKSGPALPNANELKFEDIFTGDNSIILPEGEDHLELVIWAEDANGNITRKVYEVHID